MFTNESINTDEIRDKLNLLDKYCFEQSITAEFVVVGGSAMNLLLAKENVEFRPTHDIDIAGLDLNSKDKLHHYLLELGIEPVDGVLLPDVPELMDSENIIYFDDDYTNLTVYLPSYEMQACIKSLTNRHKDYEDIINSGILNYCDIHKLIDLIEEYKDYLLNPNPLYSHYRDVLIELQKRLRDSII